MIIDTHAHYDDKQFDGTLPELLIEMKQNGVDKIITCSVDIDSSENLIKLCKNNDMLYATVGIYPHETHKQEWDFDKLEKLATQNEVVAIGEIGLDYYYDDSPKETQIRVLKSQLEIANRLNLPVTFHDRDAHSDTLNILKEFKPKGVLHCFSGSYDMAKEIVNLGMYLGIGGALTFKNARVLPEVVKQIPIDFLVLETDAPYMSPVPMRGKRNRSDYIKFIAQKIAEIKGISLEEVYFKTSENAKQIFNI